MGCRNGCESKDHFDLETNVDGKQLFEKKYIDFISLENQQIVIIIGCLQYNEISQWEQRFTHEQLAQISKVFRVNDEIEEDYELIQSFQGKFIYELKDPQNKNSDINIFFETSCNNIQYTVQLTLPIKPIEQCLLMNMIALYNCSLKRELEDQKKEIKSLNSVLQQSITTKNEYNAFKQLNNQAQISQFSELQNNIVNFKKLGVDFNNKDILDPQNSNFINKAKKNNIFSDIYLDPDYQVQKIKQDYSFLQEQKNPFSNKKEKVYPKFHKTIKEKKQEENKKNEDILLQADKILDEFNYVGKFELGYKQQNKNDRKSLNQNDCLNLPFKVKQQKQSQNISNLHKLQQKVKKILKENDSPDPEQLQVQQKDIENDKENINPNIQQTKNNKNSKKNTSNKNSFKQLIIKKQIHQNPSCTYKDIENNQQTTTHEKISQIKNKYPYFFSSKMKNKDIEIKQNDSIAINLQEGDRGWVYITPRVSKIDQTTINFKILNLPENGQISIGVVDLDYQKQGSVFISDFENIGQYYLICRQQASGYSKESEVDAIDFNFKNNDIIQMIVIPKKEQIIYKNLTLNTMCVINSFKPLDNPIAAVYLYNKNTSLQILN